VKWINIRDIEIFGIIVRSSYPAGQRAKAIVRGKVFIQLLIDRFIEVGLQDSRF
jgi:hypothetical protein